VAWTSKVCRQIYVSRQIPEAEGRSGLPANSDGSDPNDNWQNDQIEWSGTQDNYEYHPKDVGGRIEDYKASRGSGRRHSSSRSWWDRLKFWDHSYEDDDYYEETGYYGSRQGISYGSNDEVEELEEKIEELEEEKEEIEEEIEVKLRRFEE